MNLVAPGVFLAAARARGRLACLTIGLLVWTVAAAFSAETEASRRAELLPRPIISRSGQFFIYAPDMLWAVQFAVSAERVKSFVRERLNDSAPWRDPILVVVHDEKVPPNLRGAVHLSARTVSGQQIHYLLNCYAPLDAQKLLVGLVEALSIEFAQRKLDGAASAKTLPRSPLWWTQGLAESLREDWREGNEQFLARAWSDGIPSMATALLSADKLPEDELERRYFRAQCGAFARALTASTDGAAAAAEFLARLQRGEPPDESFRRAFQVQFPDERALEKWWAIECVAQTKSIRAGFLAIKESASALDKLLVFRLASARPNGSASVTANLSVDEIWTHFDKPEIKLVLEQRVAQLRLLAGQAHPLFAQVVELHATALERLEQGKINAFWSALRRARETRARVEAYGVRVRAWMDEVESSVQPRRDEFGGYFEEMQKLRMLDAKRTSLIKNYLDEVEKEFSEKPTKTIPPAPDAR
jgi:hypothetical protein